MRENHSNNMEAKEEIKACVLIHFIVWQKPLQYCSYPPIKAKQNKNLYLNHTLKRFLVYLIWNWTWVLHVFSVPSVVFFVYANCMVIH